jgi:hypothetical protein
MVESYDGCNDGMARLFLLAASRHVHGHVCHYLANRARSDAWRGFRIVGALVHEQLYCMA